MNPRKLLTEKTILWSSVFFILVIRGLYILSFPFNFGGDGSIYYTMILEKHSNLIMAPGYPYFLMLPYHFMRKLISLIANIPTDPFFNPWWVTSKSWLLGSQPLDSDISWIAAFQDHGFIVFQHAIELLAMLCGFLLARKYFGFWISIIFLLLYGLSPSSLEDCSSCRPEWLQGAVVVFWVYIADKVKEVSFPKKLILYGVLGLLCSAGFLIKFNALPIFLLLLGILLFYDRPDGASPFLKRCVKVSVFAALAISQIWVFLATFHRPTTGSSALTVNSWILADKAFQFMPTLSLPKENGVYAKRVLAMKRGLPLTKGAALDGTYFRKLNLLQEIRKPYRNQLLWILNASEQDLDPYLALTGTDSIFEQQSLLSIAYYIGLEEYGELLKKMYIEAVIKFPIAFLHDTTMGFLQSFSMKEKSNLYRPSYGEVQAGRSSQNRSSFGFVKFLWPSDRGICYHENVVWLPGVWLFTKMSAYWPPTWLLWFCAFLSFFFAALNREGHRAKLIVGAMIILLLFVFGSNMICNEFRIKDYRCIHLFVSLLGAVGLHQMLYLGKAALRAVRYKRLLYGK